MSVPFNPHRGLIQIPSLLDGPACLVHLLLSLDTGATDTVISAAMLLMAGYDPALASNRVQVVTGSGVADVPLLTVNRLNALGQDRLAFPVLGLTLPSGTSVDGVLGLDFLRGQVLTVDFRSGLITLA